MSHGAGWVSAGASFVVACSLVTSLGDLKRVDDPVADAGDEGAIIDGGSDSNVVADEGAMDAQLDAPQATFAFRRRVSIMNGSPAALAAGYTIRVPLDGATLAKVRTDGNDLRIFADAPHVERNRTFDPAPPNQAPAVWFALGASVSAGATDTGYWLYYGQAAAGPGPQTRASVFPIYEEFEATTAPAGWLVNGSPVFAGGTMTLRMGNEDALTTIAASDGVDAKSVFEARATVTNPASLAGASGYFYWLGYQHLGDFGASAPWSLWIARNHDTIEAELSLDFDASTCTSCSSAPFAQTAAARWYRIERTPTGTRYFLDGNLQAVHPDGMPVDYSLMLRNYAATSDLVIDWVRARSLASPEPSVSLGPEELVP